MQNQFVYGLINDQSKRVDSVFAEKFRDFTLSWIRYDYQGIILEGNSVNEIINMANEAEYENCLILEIGTILYENWESNQEASLPFLESLNKWIANNNYLIAANLGSDTEIDTSYLLINVKEYMRIGNPAFESLRDQSVIDIKTVTGKRGLELISSVPSNNSTFIEILEKGISLYDDPILAQRLSNDQRCFLDTIALHANYAREGVFLFNLESYSDVEHCAPESANKGITALYSVAAGFKPNMILEAHKFDSKTKVVFVDYSSNALNVKQLLLKEWDGVDFPKFVKYLFEHEQARNYHYHLWDDATPETVNWQDIHDYWEKELERWGGETAFAKHWQQYRQLDHEFIHLSLLTDGDKIIERITPLPSDVIWWSNAFFTVYGNWHHSIKTRQLIYETFIQQLSDNHSEVLIYGSDFNNTPVNGLKAGEYLKKYREIQPDILTPAQLFLKEMRF